MANLILSGSIERFPDLRILVPHLGGGTLMLAQRLESITRREPEFATAVTQGTSWALRRLFYDSAQCNQRAPLAFAREVVGGDHLGFGSDWPYTSGAMDAAFLTSLSAEEREELGRRVAVELIPRFASQRLTKH